MGPEDPKVSGLEWKEYQKLDPLQRGPLTDSTRDSLSSTFSESSRAFSLSKVDFLEKRKQILTSMQPGRIQHPHLFEERFRMSMIPSEELFLDMTNKLGSSLYCGIEGRWKDIPLEPKNEGEVLTGFLAIIEKVLTHLGKGLDDQATHILDTHSLRIEDSHGNSFLRPDIFLKGLSHLFPVMDHSKLRAPPWATCLNASEMKVGRNPDKDYSQVGTYVEQMLAGQDNRRYAETFCLDPKAFVFHLFDRAGSCSSDPVDYHKDPWKLLALIRNILLLGERSEMDAGLDESIYYEVGKTYIETQDSKFVVSKTLFHTTDIRGPGTVYWLTSEVSKPDCICLIKDSWVKNGCERERQVYQLAGKICGIAQLKFAYDVRINGRLDCIRENRPPLAEGRVENLVHTRNGYSVYPGSKTLEKFTDQEELLEAFYAAVRGMFEHLESNVKFSLINFLTGHRKLYRKQILHNLTTPNRLLIQPSAPENRRGVLVDLSNAIILEDTDRAPFPVEPMVSKVFASRNALALEATKYPPHCIDDLESFLLILCYLTNGYDAHGTNLKTISTRMGEPSSFTWPTYMNKWFDGQGGYHQKRDLLREPICLYKVHSSFFPAMQTLVDNWQRFFAELERTRTIQRDPKFVPDAEESYKEILSFLKDALESVRSYKNHQTGEKRKADN